MSYIDTNVRIRALGRYVGDHECVALVRAWTGAPASGIWKPGIQVIGNGPLITRGTGIATFVDGHYPQSERHAAIFLEESLLGIRVIEQFQGQPPWERVIHHGSHGRQNDPGSYYVID